MNYLRKTLLWIVLLPYGLFYLGAASNQLVIVANQGKFPVRMNPRVESLLEPDADGMTDNVHCAMTSETHLNFLADIIDLHDKIVSVGDLLLWASDDILPYCWGIWLGLILYRRERDFDGDSEHKLQTMCRPSGGSPAVSLRLRS